jgi:hypothetical protein
MEMAKLSKIEKGQIQIKLEKITRINGILKTGSDNIMTILLAD